METHPLLKSRSNGDRRAAPVTNKVRPNTILSVGFGLQALKILVREDKTIRTEVQIALKIKGQVLCRT